MSARNPVSGVAALLWGGDARSKRGPKPRFTLERVVDEGIAIADEEGLDAVTMQRLAERLGSTKMALYRYVPGRAEVDALMLDRALGAPPPFEGSDWRAALKQWALELFERASAHAWSVELAQRAHLPGPQEMLWFEAGLVALDPLPLTAGEKLDVLALLSGHVMSLVRRARSGASSESELADAMAPILRARARDYPRTAAAFAAVADEDRDRALSFGIDRALDGVEALVRSRSA